MLASTFTTGRTCTGCTDFDVHHRTWWYLVEVHYYSRRSFQKQWGLAWLVFPAGVLQISLKEMFNINLLQNTVQQEAEITDRQPPFFVIML